MDSKRSDFINYTEHHSKEIHSFLVTYVRAFVLWQTGDGWNSYLGFLLLCEIIFDVESLPDLLWGFAFDHVGHRLAGDI